MDIEAVFDGFPILTTSRLDLDIVTEDNTDDLFNIYDNEKVFEFCGILPRHNKDTVGNMVGHFRRDYGKGTRIKWGIFKKGEPRELVGIAEAMDFDRKVGIVTIGYYLGEAYWGNGIATEAVGAVVDFLFTKVGANRIQAEVMPGNRGSKRVLIKNGFQLEGLLRQAAVWTGKGLVDLEVYGLLRCEYKK